MADYGASNPFEEDEAPPNKNKQSYYFSQSPTIPSKTSTDPALQAEIDRLQRLERDLDMREGVLDNRTAILVERERLGGVNPRPPNWPPLPCTSWRLVHHDIANDMPTDEARRVCKLGYIGWIAGSVTLWINLAAIIAVVVADSSGTNIGSFFIAIIYILFLTPISFAIYRILYRAARNQRPALFIIYFFFLWLQILTYAFFGIGYFGMGTAGFVVMFDGFKHNIAAGILCLICFVLWCLLGLYSFFIFHLSRMEYNKAGGLQNARKDMRNVAIQQAKEHPDLVLEGAKMGARAAANNPDLIAKGVKAAV